MKKLYFQIYIKLTAFFCFLTLAYFHFKAKSLLLNPQGNYLQNSFFPAYLNESTIPTIFYYLTLLGLMIAILLPSKRVSRVSFLLLFLFSTFCLAHQLLFYIQGAVVLFWVSLYLLIISQYLNRDLTGDEAYKVLKLGQLVCSMIFLGGVIGKITPTWWSGDLFIHYGMPRNRYFLKLTKLLGFSRATISLYYSRLAIFSEAILATLFFIRLKYSFMITFISLISMLFLSDPNIFNAIGPLIGLSLAGFILLNFFKINHVKNKSMVVFTTT